MGHSPDAFVSGSDAMLRMGLSWQLYWAFQDPDSTQRKALDELILQKLPVNNLSSDNIKSLQDECVDMIWKNMMSGDPTWDSFREPDKETSGRLKTMVENSLFGALSRDYPHRENIPSLVCQFGDILRQKLQCYESTGEDCLHEGNISPLIHQCADTTPQNWQSSESAGVRVYERNKLSLVRIDTVFHRVDASTLDVLEVPLELGSGIVWDKCGHILTNYHVIHRGLSIHSHIRVKLADQSTYVAKVVFDDPHNDVAVLHITAPIHKLIPICVGNSVDLRVGEEVYAFGNPFGLNHSLTKGVISGLHREINSVNTGHPVQDIIQTDAAINCGNSGGPLLDKSGRLVGMNTSIRSRCRESCGVGFAIPAEKLRSIIDEHVKPNVGTNLAPDPSVEQVGVSGVPVLESPIKSPASNVGSTEVIKQNIMALLGDIITFMKETKVPNQSDLSSTIGQCKMGDKMFPGMEQHGSKILLARDVCAF